MVAGLKETGALAAFGIGAIAMLVAMATHASQQWAAMAGSVCEQRPLAGGCTHCGSSGAGLRVLAIDVVLVAMLPGNRALAASYQASGSLSRIPLFMAGAIAGAFFPSLSRHTTRGMIAARAVRMYAAMAIPLMVVLATIPAPLLAALFPAKYGAIALLLRYTALTGLAEGGIGLVTAFFLAADDYSCLWWLGAGLAGYAGALVAGWCVGGVVGLAVGGATGAAVVLALAAYCLVRRQGGMVLAWIPLWEPVVTAALLAVLRPHLLLWLMAASLVGIRAVVRFTRPGARHARGPRWARFIYRRAGQQSAAPSPRGRTAPPQPAPSPHGGRSISPRGRRLICQRISQRASGSLSQRRGEVTR